MKHEIKDYKRELIIAWIFVSILILAMTSCSCSNKSLQDKCILKQPEYQHFVDQHNLQDDIDDFLNQ
jgi:hypothetical protein